MILQDIKLMGENNRISLFNTFSVQQQIGLILDMMVFSMKVPIYRIRIVAVMYINVLM